MSNLNEPMLPANEAMREAESLERLIAWDVPRVAADPEAMKAALKEYIVLLMFEHGRTRFTPPLFALIDQAWRAAADEYDAAPVNQGHADV